MKKLYVLGNWKSNKTMDEAAFWIDTYSKKQKNLPENITVIVCPAFHHVSLFDKQTCSVALGVQDISAFDTGAYTGEIAASMLEGLVTYAMIGHPERRIHFSETNEQVAEKVKKVLAHNIKPVVCVSHMDQVRSLRTLVPEYAKNGVILYEPTGAIGTGIAGTPESANNAAKEIINILGNAPVLYGGSVVPENVSGFINEEYISGVGVGGASLDAEKFIQLISYVSDK